MSKIDDLKTFTKLFLSKLDFWIFGQIWKIRPLEVDFLFCVNLENSDVQGHLFTLKNDKDASKFIFLRMDRYVTRSPSTFSKNLP